MMLKQISKKKTFLQYLLVLPLAGLMVASTSLGHKSGAQPDPASSAEAADASTPASRYQDNKAYTPVFDLEEVFALAQMPAASTRDPLKRGLTCLGPQPAVLNLDTVHAQTEEQPELLNMKKIVKLIGYPKEAEKQKITGKVVAKVLVGEDGRVLRHEFLKENHTILRDAVEAHINDLLFKPGMKEGKPAEWWVIVPFMFGMDDC